MLVSLHHHLLLLLNGSHVDHLHTTASHHLLLVHHHHVLRWGKLSCVSSLSGLILGGILLHLLECTLGGDDTLLLFEHLHH